MKSKNIIRYALIVILLLSPLNARAMLDSFDFGNGVDESRFKNLILELRCLVCQNQSLGDSDAELAHDLRVEVYELMASGKSDQEIADYLVQRYGDFVLYNPPIKSSTLVIWLGPFALLLVAGIIVFVTIRRGAKQRSDEMSASDKARIKQLLDDK